MTSSGRNNRQDSELKKRVREAFRLATRGIDRLALGVSGGSDSLAMLVLAAETKPARVELHAVTVDHGLRPEARAEAAYVGEVCAQLGVPHAILKWKRERAGAVSQAEARGARHLLFAQWAAKNEWPAIALAHTRDDRVETFLMRARQGSGWHGLAGPLPFAPSPAWPEGDQLRLVRLLLAFGREELRGELLARQIAWIEDPTNKALQYERVRVRRLIAGLDRGTYARAVNTMDRLAQMRAAVAAEARGAFGEADCDGEAGRLAIGRVNRLGAEARLRLVEAMVVGAGGASGLPQRPGLERLVARITAGDDRLAAGVTLAGAMISLRKDVLAFSQAPPRRGQTPAFGVSWRRAERMLGDPGIDLLGV